MADRITDTDALQRWWRITRDSLIQRGIPVVRGELAGAKAAIIALEIEVADEDVATILDVLAPRLATWWTEDGDDGPAAYFVALLSGDSWHVVECGLEADLLEGDDDDYDEGRGYVDRSPTPEIVEIVDRWAREIADELVAQAEVGDPHSRDAFGSAISERLAERIAAADAGIDEERYHRAVWSAQRDAVDIALRGLRLNHIRQIRTDAARYAADILATDPDLATAGKVARRDTVYHYMKTVDSQCITRDAAQPVTAALETAILARGATGSLFD